MAGFRVRVVVPDPDETDEENESDIRQALGLLGPLSGVPGAEVRLCRAVSYNLMLLADQDIVVGQRIHGLPADDWPVLHLHGGSGELSGAYRESFETIWESARPRGVA